MSEDQLSSDLESLRIDRDDVPSARGRSVSPRSSGAPGWIGRAVTTLLILGALGAGAAYGYPILAARVFKTEVRTAEISRISPVQATTAITATGYVIAQTLSRVTPRLPGRIVRLAVREGDVVRAGQVLYELDPGEQRSSLAAARARVLSSEARMQLDRQRRLVESGSAARSGVEDLEARMRPLEASLQAAQAEVRALQADVGVIQSNLGLLAIRAPFAGTVINRPPQEGEAVGPEFRALEIADLASQLVEVDVPEGRLSLVRVGGPCEISLDAFPGRRFRGEVREVGHRVDRAKATVVVRVRFVDALEGVLPEMSARVSFLTEAMSAEALRGAQRTVVPAAALTTRAGSRVVFVVEEGTVRMRPVRVGPQIGGDYELLEGPEPGTRVALSPPSTLSEGNPVREVTR